MNSNLEGFRPGTQQMDQRQGHQNMMNEITNEWRTGGKVSQDVSKTNMHGNGGLYLPGIELTNIGNMLKDPNKNSEKRADKYDRGIPGKNIDQPAEKREPGQNQERPWRYIGEPGPAKEPRPSDKNHAKERRNDEQDKNPSWKKEQSRDQKEQSIDKKEQSRDHRLEDWMQPKKLETRDLKPFDPTPNKTKPYETSKPELGRGHGGGQGGAQDGDRQNSPDQNLRWRRDKGDRQDGNRDQQLERGADGARDGNRPGQNLERGAAGARDGNLPGRNIERGAEHDLNRGANPLEQGVGTGRAGDRAPNRNPQERGTDNGAGRAGSDRGQDGRDRTFYDPSKPGTMSEQFIDKLEEKGWQKTDEPPQNGLGVWDCDGEPLLMTFRDGDVQFYGTETIPLETCPLDPDAITFFTHPDLRGGGSEVNA